MNVTVQSPTISIDAALFMRNVLNNGNRYKHSYHSDVINNRTFERLVKLGLMEPIDPSLLKDELVATYQEQVDRHFKLAADAFAVMRETIAAITEETDFTEVLKAGVLDHQAQTLASTMVEYRRSMHFRNMAENESIVGSGYQVSELGKELLSNNKVNIQL